MEKLNEKDIAHAYLGKPINEERFSEIFKGTYFYPSHCDIKTELKLNITFALRWDWKQRNIDIKFYVEVLDGILSHCHIEKRKDNYCGLYVRNSCTSLKPTQQELRLFKRAMEYVTTFSNDDEWIK